MITDTVIFFKFHIENITVWALSFPDFIIILIHAGYRTCTAGHTFAQIEIDRVFFTAAPSFSFHSAWNCMPESRNKDPHAYRTSGN